MRYIDIIRTILRNASEKDLPALTWDEQRTHLNKMRKRIDDIEIVVRCKDCRWYRDTFLDTKITPTCDRHIDDRYGTLVGGITEDSFCSYGERREP